MFDYRPAVTIQATNKFLQICADPHNETLKAEYAALEAAEAKWKAEQDARYASFQNVTVAGIDHADAPDYCDAYIASADRPDGTPLTETELDAIDADTVYAAVMGEIH